MSRVLFIYERNMPTVSIMQRSFVRLNDDYKIVAEFKRLSSITSKDIDMYDVLFFIRPNDVLSHRIANSARRAGCFIITYCDDDLLNLPKNTPSIPWRKSGLRKTLDQSHLICSSSKCICNKYGSLTLSNRTALIDTPVREDEFAQIEYKLLKNGATKIVYAANPAHVAIFNKMILPVIPELIDRYGRKISFTFIGVKPKLVEYESQVEIEYLSSMPLLQYREYMESQHFDIGLAPLFDDEFSKCKYINKYIEYSLSGVAGIYMRQEPYTRVIKDGVNGFYASNDANSWFKAICKAVDEPELRRNCVYNARHDLRTNFSEKKIFSRLVDSIPEFRTYNKRKSKCKSFACMKILYYLSRPFDKIYLSVFYLRKSGIQGLVNKMFSHYHESKAYSQKGMGNK